jgi:hypothetical protein
LPRGTEILYRLSVPAEKDILRSQSKYFDGITIGAHILLYYQSSTTGFLTALGKDVVVDPMTHLLGRSFDNLITGTGNLKRSFVKLLLALQKSAGGLIIKEDIRPLSPEDFKSGSSWKNTLVDDFCKEVIRIQMIVVEESKRSPIQQLLVMAGEKTNQSPVRLKFVCPPYFYWNSITDAWYDVSLHLALHTKSIQRDYPVFPVLCMSKDVLLDDTQITKITQDYSSFGGVVLWISDFDEGGEGVRLLRSLSRLVQDFARKEIMVYNFYGGYYSMLLSKKGLRGFSSSVCYGESKSVDTVATGGGFPKRFYVPILKDKVQEVDARTFYSDNPSLLCKCEVCAGIMRPHAATRMSDRIHQIDLFFEKLSDDLAKSHFIRNRRTESEMVQETPMNDLANALKLDYDLMEAANASAYGRSFDPSHLRNWAEAIL